jgi:hypothetical protein
MQAARQLPHRQTCGLTPPRAGEVLKVNSLPLNHRTYSINAEQ